MSSKVFRLLGLKTQVVTSPHDPFIRNRMTHVMEVVACATVLAEILGLNTDLTHAIALGHDIGHVPFGHPGEHFLAKAMGRKEFCHEVLGPLVAQKIERRGSGLNLTFETLDGMMRHSGNTAREGMTPEAWVVRYADKLAYIFHDWNDIKRMGYPVPAELVSLMHEFGANQRERTSTAMSALIEESADCGHVSFKHSPLAQKFEQLRSLMMGIYPHLTQQDLSDVMSPVLEFLKGLDIGDPFLLFSLMTDRDVLFLSEQKTKDITHLQHTALKEIIPHLSTIGPIDLCCPYLDW